MINYWNECKDCEFAKTIEHDGTLAIPVRCIFCSVTKKHEEESSTNVDKRKMEQ